MRLTFIRHAEVLESYQGRYYGHLDIPLSKYGKAQAKEVAQKLSLEKFDKVYSSDLLRCRQTVEALDLHQEVLFTEQLREKSWGRDEGKSFEEILQEGRVYKNFEQWLSELDGERIESYKERIKNYFYKTIFQSKEKNILIITHAGVIRTFLSIMQNITLEESFHISIPYTSTTVYHLNPLISL